MLRRAGTGDIAALKMVRNSVQENVLSDPSKITDQDYEWFVRNPGVALWEEQGRIVGFSAADPRDGSIWALFVAPGFEGRGIGAVLLEDACDGLKAAGYRRAWLTTDSGTRAERFNLAAGWSRGGSRAGELLFERLL